METSDESIILYGMESKFVRPVSIAISPGGNFVLIADLGSNESPPTIIRINLDVSGHVTNTIVIKDHRFTQPEAVAISPDGKRAVVKNNTNDNIAEILSIDLKSQEVTLVHRATAYKAGIGDITFSVNDDVFVTNYGGDNLVVFKSLNEPLPVIIVDYGKDTMICRHVSISPDGSYALINCSGRDYTRIFQIDLNSGHDEKICYQEQNRWDMCFYGLDISTNGDCALIANCDGGNIIRAELKQKKRPKNAQKGIRRCSFPNSR